MNYEDAKKTLEQVKQKKSFTPVEINQTREAILCVASSALSARLPMQMTAVAPKQELQKSYKLPISIAVGVAITAPLIWYFVA